MSKFPVSDQLKTVGCAMSMELLVGLPTKDTITAEAIAEPARRLGLQLAMLDDFSLNAASGFQPGELAGVKTGAEISLYEPDDPELAECFGDTLDPLARIVAFYWSSDYMEGAFALAVAAALVAGHGGVCFDPQEGEIVPVEQIVKAVHGMMACARDAAAEAG